MKFKVGHKSFEVNNLRQVVENTRKTTPATKNKKGEIILPATVRTVEPTSFWTWNVPRQKWLLRYEDNVIITENVKGGMSHVQMTCHIDEAMAHPAKRVWFSGDVCNIETDVDKMKEYLKKKKREEKVGRRIEHVDDVNCRCVFPFPDGTFRPAVIFPTGFDDRLRQAIRTNMLALKERARKEVPYARK